MADQWEYCCLILEWENYYTNIKRNLNNWICCELYVQYMGQTIPADTLCELAERINVAGKKEYQMWPENPWRTAIGLLGFFEWELVSVQYGGESDGSIKWNKAIAYFKRSKKESRAVNEPVLSFPFKPEYWSEDDVLQ